MIIKFNKTDGRIVGFTISDEQESTQGDCIHLPAGVTIFLLTDCGEEEANSIYRKLHNRALRTAKLIEMGASTIIIQNEKRMLQEAVDELCGFIAETNDCNKGEM